MPLPPYRRTMLPVMAAATMCLALSAPALAGDPLTDIKINEVESSGPADFIELVNRSVTPTDVSGLVLKDNDDSRTLAIPGGTIIAAGGFLAVDTDVGGGFTLDASDAARVFLPDGLTPIDGHSWTAHAFGTYGRCPNGTGAFITTYTVTKAAANACPAPWPGSASVTNVDQTSALTSDVSGLEYEGTGGRTRGVLWDVDNGNGRMDRLLWNGTQWVRDTANGWSAGKTLRYFGGGGQPDSEGITLTDAGSVGGVFVSSESDVTVPNTSEISVLRYDVSGAATTLNATREWNLTTDLPGFGANAGAESVEWIPDAYLVSSGFVDETTAQPYDPADYPGHGSGLFFVGLEANGIIYVYALDQGTNNNFTRVATISSGFPTFGALHWDADEFQLWVVCDNNCDGRSRVFRVNSLGSFAVVAEYARPTGMPNLNNEGFTFARNSECVAGSKPVYWADDDNIGGRVLRAGTIFCTPAPNDVLIDFGTSGLYQRMNNNAWLKLHNTSPLFIAAGDLDNSRKDEAIASFPNGLWARFNNAGAWVKLHNSVPTRFAAANVDGIAGDDLIADFGSGNGIWIRYNNTTWTQLTPATSQDIETADLDGSGKSEILIDLGASGLYVRLNNASWVKLHNLSPVHIAAGDLDGNGRDEAIIDFGSGNGIWIRYNNTTWTKLHNGTTQGLAADDFDGNGKDDVLVDFGASGLWAFNNNSSFAKLNNASPVNFATSDLDGSGKADAVIDFGGSTGLYVRYNNATWTKLSTLATQAIVGGGFD